MAAAPPFAATPFDPSHFALPRTPKIWIGCSGWNYRHWRGCFYPEDVPVRRYFEFYARHFDTVEINNTFYRLPADETFKAWQSQAPHHFMYSVKANRYLTHVKRLKDARDPLKRFLGGARLLKDRLGPILYQLPPRWHFNGERLQKFLEWLPRDLLHVFEFRDQSWLSSEVLELLERHRACFCVHDFPGLKVPRKVVGPAAYIRFHGAERKYRGQYPRRQLQSWWHWMEQQLEQGKDVYVYFNNDVDAHAISDALFLKKTAARRLGRE
jgi:uncharacterized protein YecE (DUF72 family)